ncbi:hypothetical protein WICMUC_003124 [Wickerhamomyces mucosus]|uniref:Altered inheritance of mitochondria protein 32 n=1 Tax=Wickerhamomyces mucosus TaxID=1378264 RepID=A0A9P8PM95_9ASCO|nr:hypothetical protein WICMUC_003124 [Wickerhamomyces mucosus]
MRSSISTFQSIRKSIPAVYNFIEHCPQPLTLSTSTIVQECSSCEFPPDKQLDSQKPLYNTKAAHWKHVLIHSKVRASDWSSRVELMPTELISKFGQHKRELINPHYPVLISNVNLKTGVRVSDEESLVLVYPDNKYYRVKESEVPSFMKEVLNPADHHHNLNAIPNSNEVVLICGHARRDIRCGLIAPFLESEFRYNLSARGLLYDPETNPTGVKVGLVSHIGGHIYAGNVLYFDENGKAIWYGRVKPENVDGIIEETMIKKNIIKELYRGK